MNSPALNKVAFVFDIDGTLDNGDKGQIYEPLFPLMARWLARNADLIFCTNRSRGWVYDEVLSPLISHFPQTPTGRIFTACEQGAIVSQLFPSGDLPIWRFEDWGAWPLEHRREIEVALLQAVRRDELRGQLRTGLRYQVCLELSAPCQGNPLLWLPQHISRRVRMVQTRSTLTFLNRDAGKETAMRYLLERFPDLREGKIIGFGDDGDEFARVVPTLDVDRRDRKTFDKAGFLSARVDDPEAISKLGLEPLPAHCWPAKALQLGGGAATAGVLSTLLGH